MSLSRRQRQFVGEYLTDLNGAAAARRMGVSTASARSSASRMLRKPAVRARIEAELARRAARSRIKDDAVMGELARVAFFDPGALVDETGAFIPLNALDADTRAGLGAFEIIETEATARSPAQRRLRARPGEKVRALMALTRRLGVHGRGEPAPRDVPTLTHTERAKRIMAILEIAHARGGGDGDPEDE